MSDKQQVNHGRRRFLALATTAAAGTGIALTAKYPFIDSWAPTAQAKSLGEPVDIDISKMEAGQQISVQWQGKPVWIVYRTEVQLKALNHENSELTDPKSKTSSQQPVNCQNTLRSIKPEVLVLVGICTHLGCSPRRHSEIPSTDSEQSNHDGFYCPCHGARFDLAGRVLKGSPAPTNLVVPPYKYLNETTIRIGES